MKKILNILFMGFILGVLLFPSNVKAETLRDLKNKLQKLETDYKENKNKQNQTNEQINNTNRQINQIYKDIDDMNNEIIKKQEEIVELEEEIKNKDKEIKELMNSLQITTGDSFYLEYIFNAEDITDLIYRFSVTEQITSYNNQLMNTMNDKIKENQKRNEDLIVAKEELKAKQEDLRVKLNSLNSENQKLGRLAKTIEEEIASSKVVIKSYEDAGCELDDSWETCAKGLLPPDTTFYRPIINGYVTSEFGWRSSPLGNGDELHNGIDVSYYTGVGTPIYAVANGIVKRVYWSSCGSNQVVIHHNINNKTYTSTYLHLSKTLVTENQVVSKDTIIGLMGGARGTDTCSTGAHLHLAMSTGLRYVEYSLYSDWLTRIFNPRIEINFPNRGVRWYDKNTRY